MKGCNNNVIDDTKGKDNQIYRVCRYLLWWHKSQPLLYQLGSMQTTNISDCQFTSCFYNGVCRAKTYVLQWQDIDKKQKLVASVLLIKNAADIRYPRNLQKRGLVFKSKRQHEMVERSIIVFLLRNLHVCSLTTFQQNSETKASS